MADESLSALRAEIKENVGKFYVYVLSKPGGTPFYIGYGCSGRGPMARILLHESEARSKPRQRQNKHKLNTIRAIWASGYSVDRAIDSWHAKEDDARERGGPDRKDRP